MEAIPEDAEYIGFPAFKFIFSFDPEVAKVRDQQHDGEDPTSEAAELRARLRKREEGRLSLIPSPSLCCV